MSASALLDLLPRLAGVPVLTVGDSMLDRFVYGEVHRISPEGPVPVFKITRETTMLGGAGNVVRNLAALGASPWFVSVVGDDPGGQDLLALLAREPEVVADVAVERERETTIKMRYVANHQQMLRADRETVAPLAAATMEKVMQASLAALGRAQAVILSDYGKGALPEELIRRLIAAARDAGRPVIVDPKGQDFGRYRGAGIVTPNRRELAEATRMPTVGDDQIVAAARRLVAECGIGAVLVTRSQEGMTLVTADTAEHLATEAREVYDVSGAGDTVVAMLGLAIGAGIAVDDAARLANLAAGVVVGKLGTATVRVPELEAVLHRADLLAGTGKVVDLATAVSRVAGWRAEGQRVGFTNGCFDLLHPGHVSLLAQARAACDRLIVGLNSDASTRRLKGEERPIQPEAARAIVLSSLASVDLVVIFAEDTPSRLIEAIRPDVLVKGADYSEDQVVGAEAVRSWGGHVLLADLKPGYSTTRTVETLRR